MYCEGRQAMGHREGVLLSIREAEVPLGRRLLEGGHCGILEPRGEILAAAALTAAWGLLLPQVEAMEVAPLCSPRVLTLRAFWEEHLDKADGEVQRGMPKPQRYQRSGTVSTFWKQNRDTGFRESDTNGSFPRRLIEGSKLRLERTSPAPWFPREELVLP